MAKFLGIDYGTVRVGVAISDELGMLAREVGIWPAPNFFTSLLEFLDNNQDIEAIIVGLPLNMSGQDSNKTVEAREFAKKITEQTGIKTILIDERLSSSMASNIVGSKQQVDSMAAQIILQTFLDQQKPNNI